jgi:hypothetical protein
MPVAMSFGRLDDCRLRMTRTRTEPYERLERACLMTDPDLSGLREQAADGDNDAVDQLVELATERGDADELRRLAAAGSRDAVDLLVELATEREDIDELRRLAADGNRDAADVLAELTEEDNDTR